MKLDSNIFKFNFPKLWKRDYLALVNKINTIAMELTHKLHAATLASVNF